MGLLRPSEGLRGCSNWRHEILEPLLCLSHPHVAVASGTPRSNKVYASSLATVESGTRVWQTPSRHQRYPSRPCRRLSCGYLRQTRYNPVENSNSEAAPFHQQSQFAGYKSLLTSLSASSSSLVHHFNHLPLLSSFYLRRHGSTAQLRPCASASIVSMPTIKAIASHQVRSTNHHQWPIILGGWGSRQLEADYLANRLSRSDCARHQHKASQPPC